MYWTDVKMSKIKRSFLNGTNVTTLIDSGVKQPGKGIYGKVLAMLQYFLQVLAYVLLCAHTPVHVHVPARVHVHGCLVAVVVYMNEVHMSPIC